MGTDTALRILQVSTADAGGGAERIAYALFEGYRARGQESWLAVGARHQNDSGVFVIPNEGERQKSGWRRLWARIEAREASLRPYEDKIGGAVWLRRAAHLMRRPVYITRRQLGHENFESPGTAHLLRLPPAPPDILHAHNLHGEYFDLRALPGLSRRLPVLLTLHDMWLLTGHCAHSMACGRWETGCGHCPDLDRYPAVLRDATAYNWRRKAGLYAEARLYVTTPSGWLMALVERSMLRGAIRGARVIPNGVDVSVFRPESREVARAALGLPDEAFILLGVGNRASQNPYKDVLTLRRAVERLAEQDNKTPILLLCLGDSGEDERLSDSVSVRYIPYLKDARLMARYYQAADVFLHAAHADTFPTTILEALACGLPVVATAVGGVPEQLQALGQHPEPTGVLVPTGDAAGMAEAVRHLREDDSLRAGMGKNAVQDAQQRFSLHRMIDDYLNWYREIRHDFTQNHAGDALV